MGKQDRELASPVSSHGFVPHPFVKGGSLQTIIGHYARRKAPFPPDEILKAEGPGSSILLNIPRLSSPRTPVVILFHELGSSARDGQMAGLAQKLSLVGLRTARVDHQPAFHPGGIGDIRAAMTAVAQRWPGAPIALSGLGLSGTMILNLLGREPNIQSAFPTLAGALAVCPTLDFAASRETLSTLRIGYLGHLYASFGEYDQSVVAQQREFKDIGDYYRSCSPTHVVSGIRIPTLVLAAADDPVNPVATLLQAPFSDAVTLKIEASGGHLGFYAKGKTRFGDNRWLDESIVSWWQHRFLAHDAIHHQQVPKQFA